MDVNSKIFKLQKYLHGEVYFRESLARHTTWKIGGPADVLVVVFTEEQIRQCLYVARNEGLEVTILGNGSNVLVMDDGVRGMVIKIAGGLEQIQFQDKRIKVGAGILLPKLAYAAAKAGLSGLEFGVGIPGTVGGAIFMNAGTRENCLGDLLESVYIIDFEGRGYWMARDDMYFGYRESIFQEKEYYGIIAGAVLKVSNVPCTRILKNIKKEKENRQKRQPLKYPSAGSVFKNPPGYSAGFLIERAGCKGLKYGEAQVAHEHANFIINLGGARAREVMNLIAEVQKRVREKFGIMLEREVRILGEQKAELS